ncbi:MAG TPA: lipoyl(octanoyl) transferase LipB [Geminicoccaceae bacterium]|nr:lipoyl(octanoyl) transferase LipB [Geminicoccus sp.]HMU52061.1 lipoyl(octanoyl) transferase LipB [Geminicoccaceae bacterium]
MDAVAPERPVAHDTLEWRVSRTLVPYPESLAVMEDRVAELAEGRGSELVWLLEHPPLYTSGTSAAPDELLGRFDFPVYRAGRGGRFTYHGPGQRVAYVVLDLRRRRQDVRRFVWALEEWLIRSLARLGVEAGRREGRIGVWVSTSPVGEAKIAALGVRVRRWITYHGVAVNLSPDLTHFSGIVPCGISDYGVTSLAALGNPATMDDLDEALRTEFDPLLGVDAW